MHAVHVLNAGFCSARRFEDADANIIFAAAFDPALDGKIRVSVVATGMEDPAAARATPNAAPSVFTMTCATC